MSTPNLLLAALLSPLLVDSKVQNGWNAELFAYERPNPLRVIETTPTAAQVSWIGRPAQVNQTPADLETIEVKPAKPLTYESIDIRHLRYADGSGEVVTALLCTPAGKEGPFPVVIAVHGLTSNKAQVCAQVGKSLVERGFAVLAPDMPRHGERPGNPYSLLEKDNPLKAFENLRQSVIDVRLCIDIAENRKELDTSKGVILAGYSMGCWINAIAGPTDPRVKAMVLMAGGAHEIPAASLKTPKVAACDPRLALQHFSGPLLLLNGKNDNIVTPAMTRRLFDAAPEPKKITWYDCGHLLSTQAYADAAKWIEEVTQRAAEGESATRVPSRLH